MASSILNRVFQFRSKKNITQEELSKAVGVSRQTIISAILIILLAIFLNPFNFLMPPPFLSMLVIILIAIFGMLLAKILGFMCAHFKH